MAHSNPVFFVSTSLPQFKAVVLNTNQHVDYAKDLNTLRVHLLEGLLADFGEVAANRVMVVRNEVVGFSLFIQWVVCSTEQAFMLVNESTEWFLMLLC